MESKTKRPDNSLLSYRGELLQFELEHGIPTDQGVHSTSLTCSHFKLSNDRQRIHRCRTTSIKVENPPNYAESREQIDVCIIKCATISLEPLGLCRPVVMLAFTNSKITKLFTVYAYNATVSSRLAKLCSFTCPTQIDTSEVHLLDGPAFFCHYRSSIFISIWNCRSNQFQSSQHSVPFNAPNSIKLIVRENQQNFLIVAGAPSQTNLGESDLFEDEGQQCSDNSDWLLLRANLEQLDTLQGLNQLPFAYAAVTEKLLLLEFEDSCFVSSILEFEDSCFGGSILLATSMSQLVLVRPDGSRQICNLPFGDVAAMRMSTVGEQDNIVLITSEARGVCCVDLRNLTVIKFWPDCSAVFSDDFLVTGSDQILLVRDGKEVEGCEFILTDLIHVWPSNQPGVDEDSKTEDIAHRSMLNAVSALELRLQSSSNALQRLQLQSNQKEAVIQNGRTILDEIISQSGRKAESQPDLILVLGNKDEATSLRQGARSVKDDDAIPLKAESFWKRIIGRKFICGILVINTGAKPISDICILLVPNISCGASTALRGHGNSVHPSVDAHLTLGDKTDGCYLQEGERSWVTVATDCPLFDSAPIVSFDVVLIWKEHVTDDCKDSARRDLERRKCLLNCSLCFRDLENLSIDVTTVKLKSGEITKVDFLALDCIQLHSPLNISTRHTALTKVPDILCNDFGFVHVTMDTKDGLYCDSGSLAGVRIFYHMDNQTTLKLLVNTWDRHQLVLFLRNLISVLPFDVSVTSQSQDRDAGQATVKSVSLSHLQNELEEIKKLVKGSPQGLLKDEPPRTDVSKDDLMTLRLKSDGAMIMLSESISPR